MLDKVLKVVKIAVWAIFGLSVIISTWCTVSTTNKFFKKSEELEKEEIEC